MINISEVMIFISTEDFSWSPGHMLSIQKLEQPDCGCPYFSIFLSYSYLYLKKYTDKTFCWDLICNKL